MASSFISSLCGIIGCQFTSVASSVVSLLLWHHQLSVYFCGIIGCQFTSVASSVVSLLLRHHQLSVYFCGIISCQFTSVASSVVSFPLWHHRLSVSICGIIDCQFSSAASSVVGFHVCCRYRGMVGHCKILQRDTGYGFADPFFIFPTLRDLVLHYHRTSLAEHNNDLDICLLHPVRRALTSTTTSLTSPHSHDNTYLRMLP